MVKQNVERPIAQITKKISQQIMSLNLTIVETDLSRPWGGYLRISDTKISTFYGPNRYIWIRKYF